LFLRRHCKLRCHSGAIIKNDDRSLCLRRLPLGLNGEPWLNRND
jgi:hypothetical protein